MARKTKKDEYYRFFTVTEPRTHEKGHTEYKVTARFVSKNKPEDVKEVVVWRRYTELKKLHGELAYTHRNLFRRQEEFPPFPRAQLFGRFDEAVIEERRNAAEAMLLFTTNIPALYNSPQLKEFFRGGEVRRPLEACIASSTSLPPPLIPLPKGDIGLGAEEETGTEAPILTQELECTLVEKELGEPEMAVEALSNMEISPVQERHEEKEEAEVNLGPDQETSVPSPELPDSTVEQNEEFDSLFDCAMEEPLDGAQPLLSDNDLAIFDPCAKEEQDYGSPDHSELLALKLPPQDNVLCGEEADYVNQATRQMTAARESENEGDYSMAITGYRTAVEILMKGIQGDVDPQQRDALKRRVAECLEHAERLLSLQTLTQQNNT